MITTPWDKDMPEIVTKGIDSIKGKYLKKVGESSIKDLSLTKAEQMFVFVIEDFKNGTLSSDELADFGEVLFHDVAKKYPKSNLFQASLSASELTFYLRSKRGYKDIPYYLDRIDKFYKHHKSQP